METLIKLNNQTAGRDKTARLIQYSSKLLWFRLQQQDKNGVQMFKNLEYQMSTFRKLLRLGRFVESLYGALSVLRHPDSTVRLTITLSKIGNAIFLLTDHILWFGRADICNVNTDKWSRISNKYWLYSILMNLIRDFYEISKILKNEKSRIILKDGCKNLNNVIKSGGRALICIQETPSVMLDTVKNCCDFLIPLTALGHIKLSADTIGLLGTISSIAGLIALIYPVAKLTPA